MHLAQNQYVMHPVAFTTGPSAWPTAATETNVCRVAVPGAPMRYQYDPYRAVVLEEAEYDAPHVQWPSTPIHRRTLSDETGGAETAEEASAADFSDAPMQPYYATVEFKHEVTTCRLPVSVIAIGSVAPGDFVVLEGDRGEHIGRVVSFVDAPAEDLEDATPAHTRVPSPCPVGEAAKEKDTPLTDKPDETKAKAPAATPVIPNILRIATAAEVSVLRMLRVEEQRAVIVCQRCIDEIHLPVKVVDTEFQMDAKKLTVYYTSSVANDFRRLQRILFKEYRCRIWIKSWAEVTAVSTA